MPAISTGQGFTSCGRGEFSFSVQLCFLRIDASFGATA
jgi:hypothetical protein